MGRKIKIILGFLAFLLLNILSAQELSSKDEQELVKERIYKTLDFLPDEKGKFLVLDEKMQIQKIISVKKGQKTLELNLEDSSNFYITFIEKEKVDSSKSQEASKIVADSKEAQKELQDGILSAEVREKDISKYEARYERNRIFGKFLGFEPYKYNYILPAIVSANRENGHAKKVESKFQISLKKLLYEDLFFRDLDFYFAYTQQSFWQVYDSANSRPFRESNYEPELFLSYSLDKYPLFFNRVNFGFNHQSNGGDLSKSRSWNRLFIEGVYGYENFAFALRAWHRLKESPEKDDNPDILDYLGYGELNVAYLLDKHLFSATLRNNLKSDNRGAITLDYSYPIFESVYLHLQYFNGYGDSLIDYNRAIERVGVGVSFNR